MADLGNDWRSSLAVGWISVETLARMQVRYDQARWDAFFPNQFSELEREVGKTVEASESLVLTSRLARLAMLAGFAGFLKPRSLSALVAFSFGWNLSSDEGPLTRNSRPYFLVGCRFQCQCRVGACPSSTGREVGIRSSKKENDSHEHRLCFLLKK